MKKSSVKVTSVSAVRDRITCASLSAVNTAAPIAAAAPNHRRAIHQTPRTESVPTITLTRMAEWADAPRRRYDSATSETYTSGENFCCSGNIRYGCEGSVSPRPVKAYTPSSNCPSPVSPNPQARRPSAQPVSAMTPMTSAAGMRLFVSEPDDTGSPPIGHPSNTEERALRTDMHRNDRRGARQAPWLARGVDVEPRCTGTGEERRERIRC